MFRHIEKTLRHIEACSFKMIMLSRSLLKHFTRNSLVKHFQGYLVIFKDIDAYSATLTCAQLGERGEACHY